jgi:hypothetical protein
MRTLFRERPRFPERRVMASLAQRHESALVLENIKN